MSGAVRVPLLATALGIRAALPLLLWTRPLDAVLRALTPAAAPAPPERRTDALAEIEAVSDLLTRRLRPTRSACLPRALLRYALLRRAGIAAGFVIGVRPGGRDGFEAHAWVTVDGHPVMERDPLDYRPTFRWPTHAGLHGLLDIQA